MKRRKKGFPHGSNEGGDGLPMQSRVEKKKVAVYWRNYAPYIIQSI